MMKKYLIILFACISYLGYGQDVVNVGTSANAGDGDPLRTAFQKINVRFAGDMDSISAHQSRIAGLETSVTQPSVTYIGFTPRSDISGGLGYLYFRSSDSTLIFDNSLTGERLLIGSMPDTISSNLVQHVLTGNYYRMVASAAGAPATNSVYNFTEDSVSWNVFNSVELASNNWSITESAILGKYLGTTNFSLNSSGITLNNDSIFLTQQAGTRSFLRLNPTGSVYTETIPTISYLGFEPKSDLSGGLGYLYFRSSDSALVFDNYLKGEKEILGVMPDTIDDDLSQRVLTGNYYQMVATAAGSPATNSVYRFEQDSISWNVFNSGELASNTLSISESNIFAKYLGTTNVSITSSGITLTNDSIFFTNQAGAGDVLLSLSPTGSLQTEAIEEASKILVMPLEPAWKRFFDRQNGELKAYYIDKNKEVKYMYGLGSPAQSITQIQGNTEINLRYIIRLWLAVGLLFVMNIGLFVYVIKLKR